MAAQSLPSICSKPGGVIKVHIHRKFYTDYVFLARNSTIIKVDGALLAFGGEFCMKDCKVR